MSIWCRRLEVVDPFVMEDRKATWFVIFWIGDMRNAPMNLDRCDNPAYNRVFAKTRFDLKLTIFMVRSRSLNLTTEFQMLNICWYLLRKFTCFTSICYFKSTVWFKKINIKITSTAYWESEIKSRVGLQILKIMETYHGETNTT
jgi:hypothetical protein